MATAAPSSHVFEPADAHRRLTAFSGELLAAWRGVFHPQPELAPRALETVEQVLLPRPLRRRRPVHDPAAVREQVEYSACRLAKLGVPLRQVHEAFALFAPLAMRRLAPALGREAAEAAQQWFHQQAQAVVAEAYVSHQNATVRALLSVLDAELHAATLPELLDRLLASAAGVFPLRWAEVLLADGHNRLRHAASYGLGPGMIRENLGVGTFFRQVLRSGEPAFLLDAANDPRIAQPYYRALEIKSVWAVPLVRPPADGAQAPLGILTVAFDRVYECLPAERDLLLALAERSTLAIERTRLKESLTREQDRVTELSRRLLDAQDEERRRISRDLHDETGQALLALRLYLEMGLRQPSQAEARQWLKRGLALVDQSVAELRRIMAQLSPLLLDELGLEAALRFELRRLRAQQQWRTRFRFAAPEDALDRNQQVLAYRVVLEGLRNIARHARARQVHLEVHAAGGMLAIRLRDDGVGLAAGAARPAPGHFGLAGMRERVRLAGGRLRLASAPGRGVALDIAIPLAPARPRAAHAS